MGCDIHLHIELKDKEGNWHHYGEPSINRNYSLFGFLAGVRDNNIKPIKPYDDKFPKNASLITRVHYGEWKLDSHSLRVFGSNDIAQIYKRWDKFKKHADIDFFYDFEHNVLRSYCFGNSFCKDSLPEEFVDIRFIFWFDN